MSQEIEQFKAQITLEIQKSFILQPKSFYQVSAKHILKEHSIWFWNV